MASAVGVSSGFFEISRNPGGGLLWSHLEDEHIDVREIAKTCVGDSQDCKYQRESARGRDLPKPGRENDAYGPVIADPHEYRRDAQEIAVPKRIFQIAMDEQYQQHAGDKPVGWVQPVSGRIGGASRPAAQPEGSIRRCRAPPLPPRKKLCGWRKIVSLGNVDELREVHAG